MRMNHGELFMKLTGETTDLDQLSV